MNLYWGTFSIHPFARAFMRKDCKATQLSSGQDWPDLQEQATRWKIVRWSRFCSDSRWSEAVVISGRSHGNKVIDSRSC